MIAEAEGKTLSAVIQDALRATRKERLKREFYQIQGYWSHKAKEKGILDYLKDKSFEPKKNMSRAESAEMISRTTLAKQKIDAMLDFGSGY